MGNDVRLAVVMVGEAQSALKAIGSVDHALSAIPNAVKGVTSAIGGMVSGLGAIGLAAGGLRAITGAAVGAGNALGLGLASEMEQTRAQFMAFTKDGALTENLLADVRVEANKTPFAFKELAAATASLIPASKQAKVPLDELRNTAEILAASNPAQGLEGAAMALREAVSGDFTSVIERFNLPRTRINELKEQGVPALKAVQTAMSELGIDASLVAGMAETSTGKWSTFMDTIDTLKLTLATPLFEALKGGLTEAQGLLDANMATFQEWARIAGEAIGAAVRWLVTELPGAITGAMAAIKPFTDVLTDLGRYLIAVVEDGDVLNDWLGHLPAEIQPVAKALGAFIEGARIQFEFFADVVEQALSGDVMGALKHLISGMAETRVDLVTSLLAWAKAFIEWVAPMAKEMLGELDNLLQDLLGFIARTAVSTIEALAPVAAAFIDWIGPQIPGLLRELGAFAASMFEWLIAQMPAIGAKLGDWGKAFIEWIAPRIGPMLLELGKLLIELANWIMGTALPKLQAELVKWGEAFVMWVAKDALPKIGAELDKLMNALLAWTRQAAVDAGNAAVQIGKDFVSGIGRGIDQLKGWLGQQVTRLITGAVAQAETTQDSHSPSRVTADLIGRPFVWGIGKGMLEEMPWLREQAATVARDSIDAYIAEIDRGVALSQNAWRRVMNPPAAGGGGGGGAGGGGGGTGGGGDRPDTGGTYSGPARNDPLYQQLLANAGWHSQVPGRGPLDIGSIDYDPIMDTERGHGTAGTNKDKSGHYRVLYRINSLLSAGQATSVQSALRSAVEWVRANTPQQYWGGLGWTIDGRARGGPVWPGRSYLVGERGPELLSMGGRAGHVTPMGGVTNITVHVHGSVATEGRIVDAIHSGLLRKQRLNGSLGLA